MASAFFQLYADVEPDRSQVNADDIIVYQYTLLSIYIFNINQLGNSVAA